MAHVCHWDVSCQEGWLTLFQTDMEHEKVFFTDYGPLERAALQAPCQQRGSVFDKVEVRSHFDAATHKPVANRMSCGRDTKGPLYIYIHTYATIFK